MAFNCTWNAGYLWQSKLLHIWILKKRDQLAYTPSQLTNAAAYPAEIECIFLYPTTKKALGHSRWTALWTRINRRICRHMRDFRLLRNEAAHCFNDAPEGRSRQWPSSVTNLCFMDEIWADIFILQCIIMHALDICFTFTHLLQVLIKQINDIIK